MAQTSLQLLDLSLSSKQLNTITNSAIRNHWLPDEVQVIDYPYSPEDFINLSNIFEPILFSESTAFEGFAKPISRAEDGKLKLWLCSQLLDEARHTTVITNYVSQFPQPKKERYHSINRYVIIFFAHIHKLPDLYDWLFGLTTNEIFAGLMYSSIKAHVPDNSAQHFSNLIIGDEHRHRGFLTLYLQDSIKQGKFKLTQEREEIWQKTIKLCRDYFEGRKKSYTYFSCHYFGFDISQMSDTAEETLLNFISELKALQT